MSTAKLMTNIEPAYSDFLNYESKENSVTKRIIIERALDLYIQEKKRKQIHESYDKMGKDEEYLNEMRDNAEMGMEYFLDDINND